MDIESYVAMLKDKGVDLDRASFGFYVLPHTPYELWVSSEEGCVDVVRWTADTLRHEIVATCRNITEVMIAMDVQDEGDD